jgi:hypothetical protein
MSKSHLVDTQPTLLGRRSRLLDTRVKERIVKATRAGLSPSSTADYAGIGRSTYFDWLRRGRVASESMAAGVHVGASELPFLDLLDSIRQIRADIEVETLRVIENSAKEGQWRAAAWLLERAFPQRWGPSRRREPLAQPEVNVAHIYLETELNRFLAHFEAEDQDSPLSHGAGSQSDVLNPHSHPTTAYSSKESE